MPDIRTRRSKPIPQWLRTCSVKSCDHPQEEFPSLPVQYFEEMLTAACAAVREISSFGNVPAGCAAAGCHYRDNGLFE